MQEIPVVLQAVEEICTVIVINEFAIFLINIFIKDAVCVDVYKEFKDSAGQSVVVILCVNFCYRSRTGNNTVQDSNFNSLCLLADCNRCRYCAQYIPFRRFNFTNHIIAVRHIFK